MDDEVTPEPVGPDRISLQLDLDRGVEPVSGSLSFPDGTKHDFTGWIGLGAALRRLTSHEAGPPPT